MNTIVNQGLWIISGLLLLVVAWVRFNKPPTNRAGTTFLLFYSGVVFYYALLIGLWLLVILILKGGGHGLNWVGEAVHSSLEDDPQLSASVPIVAALIITVTSQFKYVRNLDRAARLFCISLAAIPREADQLAIELANGAEFHVVTRRLMESVSREISTNIGSNAVNFENDGTMSSRFTRAVAIYWLFIMPDESGIPLAFPTNAGSRSAYARIMRLNDKVADQAIKLYEALLEHGLAYFACSKPTRQIEGSLNRSIHDLSYVVCSLISRYVLFQNMTAYRRRKRLSSMGFNASDHLPAFGLNQWAASIGATIILFSFFSVIVPGQQPFLERFLYSVLMSVNFGIALIGGTMVAQRFIRRDEGESTRFPPFVELMVAGLVVLGLCVAIRIGWPLIPTLIKTGKFGLNESLELFGQRWAFVLLPFVCTFSIGLLCSYLGTSNWGSMRLTVVGGIFNGLSFAITGFLIGQLLPEDFLTRISPNPYMAELVLMGITGGAGTALGAIVLAVFPRSIRSAQAVACMGGSPSANICKMLPALEDPTSQALATTVMSTNSASRDLGGYVRANVEEFEGRYVCFRPNFSDPKVINAYLVVIRWDEKRSCLIFEEQNRPDSAHTQKGMVYVPDGKPFMSLVTIDKGSVRLIMVARPEEEIARGMIMTLAHPGGTHFVPTTAPLVLRRLGETVPELGFVHSNTPDYDLYLMQLRSVTPHFGKLVSAGKNTTVDGGRPVRLALVQAAGG